jgi:hypothetical protein
MERRRTWLNASEGGCTIAREVKMEIPDKKIVRNFPVTRQNYRPVKEGFTCERRLELCLIRA